MCTSGPINSPNHNSPTDTPQSSVQQSAMWTNAYRKGQARKAADELASRGTQPAQSATRFGSGGAGAGPIAATGRTILGA